MGVAVGYFYCHFYNLQTGHCDEGVTLYYLPPGIGLVYVCSLDMYVLLYVDGLASLDTVVVCI